MEHHPTRWGVGRALGTSKGGTPKRGGESVPFTPIKLKIKYAFRAKSSKRRMLADAKHGI